MTRPTPQQQAENMLAGIKHTYKIMAVRHVHPWYSWALMAVAIGFALGVTYVANQNAQFDESQAATPAAVDTKPPLVIKLSRQLPIGTWLYAIKFNAAAADPKQEYIDDDHYEWTTVTSAALTIELKARKLGPYEYSYEADNYFDPNSPIGVLAQTPTGDLFMSEPVVNNTVNFAPVTPVGNFKTQSSHYKISASLVDTKGNKTKKKFKADDLQGNWSWDSDFNAKIVNGEIIMDVPGPTPVSSDLLVVIGPDPEYPNDRDYDIWSYGNVFLPNYGSGNYEIVFSAWQEEFEDFVYPVPSYTPPDRYNEVTEVIFTPAKGGKPISSSTKPRGTPKYLYGSGALELRQVASSAAVNPKNKLRRLGSLSMHNGTTKQTIITRSVGLTVKLASSVKSQSLFPTLSLTEVTEKIKVSMETAGANKKPAHVDHYDRSGRSPYACSSNSAGIECKFWFDIKTPIKPNKSRTLTFDIDQSLLPKGTNVTASIAKQEDVTYQYGKVRYYVGPKQIPISFNLLAL